MRNTAFLLALLLVLVAGTIPALLGFSRAFTADEVALADGRTLQGTILSEADGGVRFLASGRTTEEIPAERVKEVRRGTFFPDEVETTDGAVLRGEVAIESPAGVRLVLDRKALEFARREILEVRREGALSLLHFGWALSDPFLWQVMGWTAAVAVLGTLGALLLGLPYALLTARTEIPGRTLFSALYGAPLVLPPLLTAMAWDRLLPQGWLEGPAALGPWSTVVQAAALFALAYFPFVTLFARRSLASVGAAEEEAARLVAGPWGALRRVTLPLARPGILLGVLFAFVFCLNDFSVVDYLNVVRTPAKQVSVLPFLVQFHFSRRMGGMAELMVIGLPAALLSLAAAAAALRIATRSDTATVGSAWRAPRPLPLGPAAR
ncbi:MAG: ABC transporter permease subunit, partial [Planctomycetes bacterium]|nr:ABC transporter permease subunit [Planctomycetota bacterium]